MLSANLTLYTSTILFLLDRSQSTALTLLTSAMSLARMAKLSVMASDASRLIPSLTPFPPVASREASCRMRLFSRTLQLTVSPTTILDATARSV